MTNKQQQKFITTIEKAIYYHHNSRSNLSETIRLTLEEVRDAFVIAMAEQPDDTHLVAVVKNAEDAEDTMFPLIRCYDNGGRTVDRYTVVILNQPAGSKVYKAFSMNNCPYHPHGFVQHTPVAIGKHLGIRIDSSVLTEDCKEYIRRNV